MSYEKLIECERLLAEKEKSVSEATKVYHDVQVEWQRVRLGIRAQDGADLVKCATERLQRVTNERNQLLQQRGTLVEEIRRENAQIIHELGEQKRLIVDLNAIVATKDDRIKKLTQEMEDLCKLKNAELENNRVNLKILENTIVEHNKRIEQAKLELKNQKAQIEYLKNEVKKREDALTEINDVQVLLENLKKQEALKLALASTFSRGAGFLRDLKNEMSTRSLYEACVIGDSQINYVKDAIAKGADLNSVDMEKNSPLHKACVANAVELVKLLVKSGANSEIKNNAQQKPIDLTHNPQIKLLLFSAHQNVVRRSKSYSENTEFDNRDLFNPDFSPEKDHDLILDLPLKGDAIDVSNHDNNGTQWGVRVTKGRFSDSNHESFDFDSQKYITGEVANHFPCGDRTVSLWFKLARNKETNEYKGGTLFSHSGVEYSSNLCIVINHAVESGLENKKNISVYSYGEDKELRAYVDLNDKRYVNANNNWIHLVVTSGNGKGTTLFLNGKDIAHEQFFYTSKHKISKFGIGTLMFKDEPTDFETDPMFKGNINDVRVYQRALNIGEVASLYEYQKPKVSSKENNFKGSAETRTERTHIYKSPHSMFPNRAIIKNSMHDNNRSVSKEENFLKSKN